MEPAVLSPHSSAAFSFAKLPQEQNLKQEVTDEKAFVPA
jgi:hypothetical protein